MQEKIGFDGFLERGTKSLDEFGRKVLDKTDGVGKEKRGLAFWNPQLGNARVERGEELVGDQRTFVGERVDERGFSGISVSNDRRRLHAKLATAFAMNVS